MVCFFVQDVLDAWGETVSDNGAVGIGVGKEKKEEWKIISPSENAGCVVGGVFHGAEADCEEAPTPCTEIVGQAPGSEALGNPLDTSAKKSQGENINMSDSPERRVLHAVEDVVVTVEDA